MKKRILSCALVLVMCLALVPMSAYAANVPNVTDIKAFGDTITFDGYYGKPIVWQVHAVDTNAEKALLIPHQRLGERQRLLYGGKRNY